MKNSMVAEIISVGTELLMGQVANTDAQHIAQMLAPLGYVCRYQITVGDNVQRLTEVVRTALDRSDIVLFTGGLGPTDDDLTKETVAGALGLVCVPIQKEVERLRSFFIARGREMTPNNLKQASFPESAIILPNPIGTAPGCIMESGEKAAILMPGPPRELFPMFDNYVVPYLEKKSSHHLYSRKLQFFGIGESKLTFELQDLIRNQTNPTIASYVKLGEVMLRITADCTSDEEGEALIRPVMKTILDKAGDYIYSMNGETLPEACIRVLGEKELTVGITETFTGGCVTAGLAAADRTGSVIRNSSFLTGVIPTQENAIALAGTNISGNAVLGLSVLGSADGSVLIGLTDGKETICKKLDLSRFQNDPERIRAMSALHAADTLRRFALGIKQLSDIL